MHLRVLLCHECLIFDKGQDDACTDEVVFVAEPENVLLASAIDDIQLVLTVVLHVTVYLPRPRLVHLAFGLRSDCWATGFRDSLAYF